MPIFSEQFYVMDPATPPAVGTVLNVVRLDVNDANNNGVIRPGNGDTVGGLIVNAAWQGDRITIVLNGVQRVVTGVTFYRTGGASVFTPTDGTILATATFVRSSFVTTSTQATLPSFGPACFVRGTRIATKKGPRKIEDLCVGDLIMTKDHGPQPLRWVGHSTVDGTGPWAPIRFAPGVLGNDRALLVSPQHRILVGGWQSELYYGEDEILVSAKHLINGRSVRPVIRDQVDYFHLLFDCHEVIYSEGAATESFHPGDHVMQENRQIRAEIIALFPELANLDALWPTARRVLRGREAEILAAA
jgi:hypothetical protein